VQQEANDEDPRSEHGAHQDLDRRLDPSQVAAQSRHRLEQGQGHGARPQGGGHARVERDAGGPQDEKDGDGEDGPLHDRRLAPERAPEGPGRQRLARPEPVTGHPGVGVGYPIEAENDHGGPDGVGKGVAAGALRGENGPHGDGPVDQSGGILLGIDPPHDGRGQPSDTGPGARTGCLRVGVHPCIMHGGPRPVGPVSVVRVMKHMRRVVPRRPPIRRGGAPVAESGPGATLRQFDNIYGAGAGADNG
jgi:hypothetical protein